MLFCVNFKFNCYYCLFIFDTYNQVNIIPLSFYFCGIQIHKMYIDWFKIIAFIDAGVLDYYLGCSPHEGPEALGTKSMGLPWVHAILEKMGMPYFLADHADGLERAKLLEELLYLLEVPIPDDE